MKISEVLVRELLTLAKRGRFTLRELRDAAFDARARRQYTDLAAEVRRFDQIIIEAEEVLGVVPSDQ